MHEFVDIKLQTYLITLHWTTLQPVSLFIIVYPAQSVQLNDQLCEDLTSGTPSFQLDAETTLVRRFMQNCMNHRFHGRYHSVKSLHNWSLFYESRPRQARLNAESADLRSFMYDYVFEFIRLLSPATCDL